MTRWLGDSISDDVGNTGGAIFIAPQDFAVLTNGAVTRNAVGDVSINQASSLTGTYTFCLTAGFLRRIFGLEAGLAADGTNAVVGDAPIRKGIKITDVTVHYQVGTLALTSISVRIDRIKFVNNVANAISVVLANAANGLQIALQANPYSTKINIVDPIDLTGYDVADNSGLYIEFSVVTPATSTFRLYGFTVHNTFNLD